MELRYPLVQLSEADSVTLYLIKEELKSQKFFNHLNEIGIGDSYFQPHLDKLILANVGLDDGKDETTNFYVKLIDRRSKKIHASNKSVMKQAMKVYVELINERMRRKSNLNP